MLFDLPPMDFAARRRRVMDRLGGDAALILAAAPEVRVGRDLDLRYRQDADFHYLTGLWEPEAVVVLCPARAEAPFTVFARPRDPEMERWTGPRLGPEGVRELVGADAAFPIAELEERLPRLVEDVTTLYFRLDCGRPDVERLVLKSLVRGRNRRQRHGRGPIRLVHPCELLDEDRLVKDGAELARIREAARITVAGFRAGARAIRPDAGEWEVEAAIEGAFRSAGAFGPAFATILASGANATVLHYIDNARTMRAGELVLIDAGAQVDGYNADVSRTYPVSGRFSGLQRELYDAVLAAYDAALAVVRPGAAFDEVHRAALRPLAAALLEHGLLEGELEEVLEQERYRPFYPYRTAHWLGLDVHDVGDYVLPDGPRILRPGMVFTIEPGIYVPPDLEGAPEALRGIGIRVEDDVLVTDDGAEVLTAGLPIRADDVEAMLTG